MQGGGGGGTELVLMEEEVGFEPVPLSLGAGLRSKENGCFCLGEASMSRGVGEDHSCF